MQMKISFTSKHATRIRNIPYLRAALSDIADQIDPLQCVVRYLEQSGFKIFCYPSVEQIEYSQSFQVNDGWFYTQESYNEITLQSRAKTNKQNRLSWKAN